MAVPAALLMMFALALGVALATTIGAKPTSGPRDNGSDVHTPITVSGDLSDTVTTGFTNLGAYWDLPAGGPNSSFLMTNNGWSIGSSGVFNVPTEVPLYDGNANTVRPGIHKITVCATPNLSTNGFPICLTTNFTVLKGIAAFSPASGRPSNAITVSGSRWVPGNGDEEIWLTWNPTGSAIPLSSTFFPGSSTWTTTFNVPNAAVGTYQIQICSVSNLTGNCVPQDDFPKSFTVVPPVVTLSKSSGLQGASINISGTRFLLARTMKLFFGPPGKAPGDPSVVEISPGTAKGTDDFGKFGPYPYAPPNPPGSYIVTACTILRVGCDPNDTATAPYTINPPPTPSPSPTPTITPTHTPTVTQFGGPTPTPSPTGTAAAIPSSSISPTPSGLATPSASNLATPTSAASGTASAAGPSPAATATAVTPSSLPTPTATPSPTPEAVIWAEQLRSPGDSASGGPYSLTALGGMGLLALLIAFLIPFPGTLFNKTVEANYTEIRTWMAGLRGRWNAYLDAMAIGPLGGLRRWLGPRMGGRTGVFVFLALSALVYGFLSPSFGLNSSSLALFLGLLVGLALITAAFDLPLRIYHRRRSEGHDSGVLRALWWTLLIAIVCVLVSRLAGFQPGLSVWADHLDRLRDRDQLG